jgi:hypothetical protein
MQRTEAGFNLIEDDDVSYIQFTSNCIEELIEAIIASSIAIS